MYCYFCLVYEATILIFLVVYITYTQSEKGPQGLTPNIDLESLVCASRGHSKACRLLVIDRVPDLQQVDLIQNDLYAGDCGGFGCDYQYYAGWRTL